MNFSDSCFLWFDQMLMKLEKKQQQLMVRFFFHDARQVANRFFFSLINQVII